MLKINLHSGFIFSKTNVVVNANGQVIVEGITEADWTAGKVADEDGNTIVQTETIPFKTAQALWNYKTVEKDHSHGIHNPAYARALIKNALQVVQ